MRDDMWPLAAVVLADMIIKEQKMIADTFNQKPTPASCEKADEVERVTGWRPPVIYDVSTDTYRLATQADLDAYAVLSRSYSTTRQFLRKIDEEHQRAVDEAKKLVRATVPNGETW